MANLSKFHVVFSSSTLIRLDKNAFEGHLCQTVNNFVKQDKSILLSPLRIKYPSLLFCVRIFKTVMNIYFILIYNRNIFVKLYHYYVYNIILNNFVNIA